jgi:hypothetical protein
MTWGTTKHGTTGLQNNHPTTRPQNNEYCATKLQDWYLKSKQNPAVIQEILAEIGRYSTGFF